MHLPCGLRMGEANGIERGGFSVVDWPFEPLPEKVGETKPPASRFGVSELVEPAVPEAD